MSQISVIIATYNRCESLKDTLNSLLNQECDGSFDYEVIVVDNNSNDKTKEVVESYISKFGGNLMYLFEPKQGKSYALNRGIGQARGEIITLTDDDCIVDKNWVFYLQQTFVKYNADLVGGKILINWPDNPPKWLFRNYIKGKLGFLDYGDNEFQIVAKNNELYGDNSAFKKIELINQGLFEQNLGRKGKYLFAAEDKDIFLKFLSANKKIYYQPKAVVYHKILPERLKKSFFRRRCFDGARTKVRAEERNLRVKRFFNIPKYLIKELMGNMLKYTISLITFNSEELFHSELQIFYTSGKIYEHFISRNKSGRIL